MHFSPTFQTLYSQCTGVLNGCSGILSGSGILNGGCGILNGVSDCSFDLITCQYGGNQPRSVGQGRRRCREVRKHSHLPSHYVSMEKLINR